MLLVAAIAYCTLARATWPWYVSKLVVSINLWVLLFLGARVRFIGKLHIYNIEQEEDTDSHSTGAGIDLDSESGREHLVVARGRHTMMEKKDYIGCYGLCQCHFTSPLKHNACQWYLTSSTQTKFSSSYFILILQQEQYSALLSRPHKLHWPAANCHWKSC